MQNGTKMQINTSITDFAPLLKNPEYLFKGLKESGIQGIELVIGFKSRWSPNYYKNLSKKYNLPIVSLHQPIWSGLGFYFDKRFIHLAKELNSKWVVFHPLPRLSLRDRRMKDYLQKLSNLQKQTGVEILLENLPRKYNNRLINFLYPPDKETGNIESLYEAAEEFNLKLTLDTDHLHLKAPHKESWFPQILSKVKNIHLSSFTEKNKHLPLYLGDLQSAEFIKHLKKAHYTGLLTLEIFYPNLISLFGYDFTAIRKSVEHILKI